eukprot:7012014-Heterocapsa_arctica.AAC.1
MDSTWRRMSAVATPQASHHNRLRDGMVLVVAAERFQELQDQHRRIRHLRVVVAAEAELRVRRQAL